MPEVGSLNQRPTIETSTEVVGETLIFSDVIKAENFNPEDHVIFVVPESSDLVTTDGAEGEAAGYVIPTSEGGISCSSFDTTDLRETIKSNFLVITKLLPSKSPPPLLPFAAKVNNETLNEVSADEGDVPQNITNSTKTLLPKPIAKTPRQPKAPRQSTGKNQTSFKQESPEIFGKMFPASYNEVLWKQIREIIYFKCGKDTTDDTEVAAGINCPHCRKKPSSMNQLKEHLQNCHTYSSTKRKSSCPSGKSVIKKMLYRCLYCDEAFITQVMRDSHECSLAAKPLEHLSGITKTHPNTCGICFQDFGSRSELNIHQEMDHQVTEASAASDEDQNPPKVSALTPAKPALPSISKYVSCKICTKKISLSVLDEHLKRHGEAPAVTMQPSTPSGEPKKCVKCHSNVATPDSNVETCQKCREPPGEEPAICQICDAEMNSTLLDKHVMSHYNHSDESVDIDVHVALCQLCGEDFKVQATESSTTCKNCR